MKSRKSQTEELSSFSCGATMVAGFFAEFDNIVGTKITLLVPNDCGVPLDAFQPILDFLIPKPVLFDTIIENSTVNYRFLGLPTCIHSEIYERNAMMFSVGFVVPEKTTEPRLREFHNIDRYRSVLVKLVSILRTLEKETKFLSVQDPDRQKLKKIMSLIVKDLSTKGETWQMVDPANSIHLTLFPPTFMVTDKLTVIAPYDVPVPVVHLNEFVTKYSDLVLQQIVPYIDGIRYVRKIAYEAQVDMDLTVACLQNLLSLGLIFASDIFQYSNIYVTDNIGKLMDGAAGRELSLRCAEYIVPGQTSLHVIYDQQCKTFCDEENKKDGAKDVVTHERCMEQIQTRVLQLYSSFSEQHRLSEYCVMHSEKLSKINVHKLVLFGTANGLIRRLHHYPLFVPSSTRMMETPIIYTAEDMKTRLSAYELGLMDGSRHLDDLCCRVGRSSICMEEMIAKHPECLLITK